MEDAALRQSEVGVDGSFQKLGGLQGVRVSSNPVLPDRLIGGHLDPKVA